MEVRDIPLEQIALVSEFNHRKTITLTSCMSLAKSIEESGLQSPIMVRTLEANRPQPSDKKQPSDQRLISKGFKYKIIAGHRRYTAVKLLSMATIPCIIRPAEELSEAVEYDLNAIENLERAEITGYEEALIVKRYLDAHMDIEAIASRLSKAPSWVRIRKDLMDMPHQIQELLHDGKIVWTDVRKLKAKAKDRDELLRLAARVRDTRAKDGSANSVWSTYGDKKKTNRRQEKQRTGQEVLKLQKKIREASRKFSDQGVDGMVSLGQIIKPSGSSVLTILLGWISGNTSNGLLIDELEEFFDLFDVDFEWE
jgi:ParB/RepB/Spo0J family partition protein